MFSIQFIFINWTEFILPEQGFYAFLKDAADLKVLKVGSGTGSVAALKMSAPAPQHWQIQKATACVLVSVLNSSK